MALPQSVAAQVDKAKAAKKTSEAPKPNQAEIAAAEVRTASAARTAVKNESDAFKAAADNTESKKAALNKELAEAQDAKDVDDAYDALNAAINEAKNTEYKVLTEEAAKAPSEEKTVLQRVLDKARDDLHTVQRKVSLDELKKQINPSSLMNNLLGTAEDYPVEDEKKEVGEQSTLKDTLVNSLSNRLMSKLNPKEQDNLAFLHWDSPGYKLGGKVEDIIAQHMQPKMKFAYIGEFPGMLEELNWLVKSMDKPKIDVESIEQIRNNVKRNYPVKYNYGDLSITFWDDMDNKTILALSNYFTNNVWQHPDVLKRGRITLRDSILIPKFSIYELTTNANSKGHLRYTFENCILSSFDFDNSEDESDDGVHTVQAVFKIERYEVQTMKSPIVLNPSNMPKWL